MLFETCWCFLFVYFALRTLFFVLFIENMSLRTAAGARLIIGGGGGFGVLANIVVGLYVYTVLFDGNVHVSLLTTGTGSELGVTELPKLKNGQQKFQKFESIFTNVSYHGTFKLTFYN